MKEKLKCHQKNVLNRYYGWHLVATLGSAMWRSFGCYLKTGMRINEVAKLKVKDLLRSTNELRTTFVIPAAYTKTDKSRAAYILARPHINAIEDWISEMIEQRVCVVKQTEFRGLNPDWPIFAVTKKGKLMCLLDML